MVMRKFSVFLAKNMHVNLNERGTKGYPPLALKYGNCADPYEFCLGFQHGYERTYMTSFGW